MNIYIYTIDTGSTNINIDNKSVLVIVSEKQ